MEILEFTKKTLTILRSIQKYQLLIEGLQVGDINQLQNPSDFNNRRQLLASAARGIFAVAVVSSASLILLKTTPAEASCGQGQGNGGPGGNENGNGNLCGGGGNCFLRGTLISTPSGAAKIEDLSIGDLVVTNGGEARPIQFVSSYRYKKTDPFRDWVSDVRPVLVRKSAISDNVPNRDLYLTRGHALYIDGILIPVCNLINGSTIVVDPAVGLQELEYFHIKLESHDVILAEGTPCESLLKVSESARNFADYYRAHGFPVDEQPCAAIHSFYGGRSEIASRIRSAASCVAEVRRPLDVVRDRLEARAAYLSPVKGDLASA
jgi:hypothetical protein